MKLKLPFGILKNKELIEKFSEDPKKAAKQFLESNVSTGIFKEELEKYFPYKNFRDWMNEFGIALVKLKLKMEEKKEEELIITARTYRELTHFINVLKNREELLSNYKSFNEALNSSEKLKGKVEEKIKNSVKEIAPNLSHLLGSTLAALLIAQAKGLKNLAKMPASKIQILGAEKSLFRYLKKKKQEKMPKYGLIYISPYIKEAKDENKGKIARLLASKIMLASRLDYFSDKFEGDKLKKQLLKEIKSLREKQKSKERFTKI
jgi:nucleolar protein 56